MELQARNGQSPELVGGWSDGWIDCWARLVNWAYEVDGFSDIGLINVVIGWSGWSSMFES